MFRYSFPDDRADIVNNVQQLSIAEEENVLHTDE